MIDTNANLSRWPFRRLPGDETPELVARLRKHGATQAWVGSFDGIFHKDIAGVNVRLAAECRKHGAGFLVPFGSVNLMLPDWRDDLRRCREEHRMPGIRLHPNYHGYTLSDPAFAELLHLAAARRMIVQLAVSMEDLRTQGPLVRVPPVDLGPLPAILKDAPAARVVLLNRRTGWGEEVRVEAAWFEIATVEGIEGVARLADRLPPERVLFGSHFPLFPFESAVLKVRESGLSDARKQAVLEGNAKRLLGEAAA